MATNRSGQNLTAIAYTGPPTSGWSPDVPSWELPGDQAPDLVNWNLVPGKLTMRHGISMVAGTTSAPVSSSEVSAGAINILNLSGQLGQVVLVTRRNFGTAAAWPGYVEPHNMHRLGYSSTASGPAVSGAAANPTLVNFSRSNGAWGNVGGTANLAYTPQSHMQPFGGTYLGITYGGGVATSGATSVLIYDDNVYSWRTSLIMGNGSGNFTVPTGSPIGGFYVYNWLNRVWVLGGAPTGSLTGKVQNLMYTNPVTTLSAATDWTDPVSGLQNLIQIDQDHTNAGVALASTPVGLIIFRVHSTWIMRGTDPTSWILRPLSAEHGCLDFRSVVEYNNQVYWMADDGFYVTDGSSVQDVSGSMKRALRNQIDYLKMNIDPTQTSTTMNGGWCTAGLTQDGKIIVTFGGYGTPVGSVLPQFCTFTAQYDTNSGTWVEIATRLAPIAPDTSSPGIGIQMGVPGTQRNGLGQIASGSSITASIGSNKLVVVDDPGALGAFSRASEGWDRDYSQPPTATPGALNLVPIDGIWSTRSFDIGQDGRKWSQLKRAFVDYHINTNAAMLVTTTLNDANLPTGSQTITTQTKSAGGQISTAQAMRETQNFDIPAEVQDLRATVTINATSTSFSGLPPSTPTVDLIGIGAEWMPGRDQR